MSFYFTVHVCIEMNIWVFYQILMQTNFIVRLCIHSLVANSATLWFSSCLHGVEELSSDPCISVAI